MDRKSKVGCAPLHGKRNAGTQSYRRTRASVLDGEETTCRSGESSERQSDRIIPIGEVRRNLNIELVESGDSRRESRIQDLRRVEHGDFAERILSRRA